MAYLFKREKGMKIKSNEMGKSLLKLNREKVTM